MSISTSFLFRQGVSQGEVLPPSAGGAWCSCKLVIQQHLPQWGIGGLTGRKNTTHFKPRCRLSSFDLKTILQQFFPKFGIPGIPGTRQKVFCEPTR
eukprot:1158318-Pelagomonas_calceolata.AAC.1